MHAYSQIMLDNPHFLRYNYPMLKLFARSESKVGPRGKRRTQLGFEECDVSVREDGFMVATVSKTNGRGEVKTFNLFTVSPSLYKMLEEAGYLKDHESKEEMYAKLFEG